MVRVRKMRKLVLINTALWLTMITLFWVNDAIGSSPSDQEQISIHTIVLGKFFLDVEKSDFVLGPLAEDSDDSATSIIHCGSNQGNKWFLQASASSIIGEINGAVIPLKNLKITTFSTANEESGKGHFIRNKPFIAKPITIYTAAPTEYADSWVTVGFALKLRIPPKTEADEYNTDIVFTMTE